MKLIHVPIAIVFCAITSVGFAQEATVSIGKNKSVFFGLWQGVDFVDGGNSYRQLLRVETVCKIPPCPVITELRGRDTWHGPCGYGDPAPITGELLPDGRNVLTGTWSLDCQAPPTDISGDRDLEVEYVYDPKQKTLTETLLNPTTGLPIGRTPIVFYKVNVK